MEEAAYELSTHLSRFASVRLVKWSRSNKWLFLGLPYVVLSSLRALLFDKVDAIYIQDGLLAPFGYVLRAFRKPVLITIHGRDITYRNKLYQLVVPGCVRSLDRIVCVSRATMQECLRRGIQRDSLTVIPDGVCDSFHMTLNGAERDGLRQQVSGRLGCDLAGKTVLLSVGRLVERKGFRRFVEDVLPHVIKQDDRCRYLIVGEGLQREEIQEAIERKGLKDHVFLLGQVDDELRRCLYNVSDVYVMPNIPVEGDMEGFGIVTLEASSCGLPVVASRLEGIQDAVKDGENGVLVEPGRADQFADAILKLARDAKGRDSFGRKAREFTLANFGWEKVAEGYLEEFERLAPG